MSSGLFAEDIERVIFEERWDAVASVPNGEVISSVDTGVSTFTGGTFETDVVRPTAGGANVFAIGEDARAMFAGSALFAGVCAGV